MRTDRLVSILLFLTLAAGAASLVNDGIIGNSGEAGETLVTSLARPPSTHNAGLGMGVVYDRLGTLWDRGAPGQLNHYAVDGRLLAVYPLPSARTAAGDTLTAVGDTLVMLLDSRLYTLPIAAPPGSRPEPLPDLTAARLSFGAVEGRLAILSEQGDLSMLDPLTGTVEAWARPELASCDTLELASDGSVYILSRHDLHRYRREGEIRDANWPKTIVGKRENSPARLQQLGKVWFGHAWHGTVKRYDAKLDPDPGVVLGGASGWFIGHVAQNAELAYGRGMADLGQGLYAISGQQGILHLAIWDAGARELKLVRRIGCLSNPGAVGLNAEGRIWCNQGAWQWADTPVTPHLLGINGFLPGPAAMLPNGAFMGPGTRYGSRPAWFYGSIESELKADDAGDKIPLSFPYVGCAAVQARHKWQAVLLKADGAGQVFQVSAEGRFERDLGSFALAVPGIARWSDLCGLGADRLLAAGDGQLVELAPAPGGTGWQPAGEPWPVAGADSSLTLAASAGRVWVADSSAHTVTCYDLASRAPLAAFGAPGQPGNGLDRLHRPQRLSAAGNRAVVFDTGNHRLVKLHLALP